METRTTHPLYWFPPMQDAEKRADIIKAAARAGMPQAKIAEAVGVNPPAVSKWLNGARLPTRCHWNRIDALGRSIGAAITGDELREPGTPYGAALVSIPNTPELRTALLEAMADRSWSFAQLARAAGYDHDKTLRRLLIEGSLDFFPNILAALVKALGLDPETLPVTDFVRADILERLPAIGHATLVRDAPVVAHAHAAALTVVDGLLETESWDDAPRLPVPTDGRDYLIFTVEGDSMEPRLHDGELVYVDARDIPSARPVPHRPAVVLVDDELLIKLWRPVDGHVHLASANPSRAAADRFVPLSEIRWARRVWMHADPSDH